MLMRKWNSLQGKEDKLVKDLETTTLSFKKLGKKYGVSKQAVHAFFKRQRVKRPLKPKGHQYEECPLCQKLIEISRVPHSEFISIHTIATKTGGARFHYHLQALRDRGMVDERFGRLQSKRAEKAYAIYFKRRLPISTIGRKCGLKNFQSVIARHRKLGWSVPPSLYKYDGRERSRIQCGSERKHKRT